MPKPIFDNEGNTGVRGAARHLDVSEMQMGVWVRKGVVDATKDEAGHWVISQATLDAWKSRPSITRNQAATGRFKVAGWMNDDELSSALSLGLNVHKIEAKGPKAPKED